MLIKKDQDIVVRSGLKRIFTEMTKIARKLRAEEFMNVTDRHITNVTSLDVHKI